MNSLKLNGLTHPNLPLEILYQIVDAVYTSQDQRSLSSISLASQTFRFMCCKKRFASILIDNKEKQPLKKRVRRLGALIKAESSYQRPPAEMPMMGISSFILTFSLRSPAFAYVLKSTIMVPIMKNLFRKNDISSSSPRLIELGPDPYTLGFVLEAEWDRLPKVFISALCDLCQHSFLTYLRITYSSHVPRNLLHGSSTLKNLDIPRVRFKEEGAPPRSRPAISKKCGGPLALQYLYTEQELPLPELLDAIGYGPSKVTKRRLERSFSGLRTLKVGLSDEHDAVSPIIYAAKNLEYLQLICLMPFSSYSPSPGFPLDYHHLTHLKSIYIQIKTHFERAGYHKLVDMSDMAIGLLGKRTPTNVSNIEIEFKIRPSISKDCSMDYISTPFSALALHLQRSKFIKRVHIVIRLHFVIFDFEGPVDEECVLECFNRVLDPVVQKADLDLQLAIRTTSWCIHEPTCL